MGKSHLDLKPENILVHEDFTIKLGDLGFISDYNHSSNNYNVGTNGYASPQIAEKKP